jgi:hypothetical protein
MNPRPIYSEADPASPTPKLIVQRSARAPLLRRVGASLMYQCEVDCRTRRRARAPLLRAGVGEFPMSQCTHAIMPPCPIAKPIVVSPEAHRAVIYPRASSHEESAQPPCPVVRRTVTRRPACAPLLRVGVGACPNVPIPPYPHAPVSHKPPCPIAEQTAAISRDGPPAPHSSAEESAHNPCPCTEWIVACARGGPPSTGRSAVPKRAQAAFPNVRRAASEKLASALPTLSEMLGA